MEAEHGEKKTALLAAAERAGAVRSCAVCCWVHHPHAVWSSSASPVTSHLWLEVSEAAP